MRSGLLPPGTRLPATRVVAERLRVNRATVVESYHLLRRDGWVRSGVGSGTFVMARGATLERGRTAQERAFWSPRLVALPKPEIARAAAIQPEGTIRFTSMTADPAAFPVPEFREALDEVFRREGPSCLDYGPPDGYRPLRDVIAERLARQGVAVDPSRVILVNGSQQGLELILRLLVPKGRTLLLEEPTYHLALRTARSLRMPIHGVPLDGEGLRIDLLRQALEATDAGMLYTMPVFQNPTGITMSPERRGLLLSLAEEKGLPIVEDHFDAELDYEGKAPPPLLAEGFPPGVTLLGTFSKILFPGLRVGWLVAPESLVGPLSEMKVCADLSSGLLTQMALAEFCRRGALDRHLEMIRERNRSRLGAVLQALETEMPDGCSWTRPAGGMTLWLRLPDGVDAEGVAEEALRRGVAVNPGPVFCAGDGGRDGVRLCFVREDEPRLREGVKRLAGAVRDRVGMTAARERNGAAAPTL